MPLFSAPRWIRYPFIFKAHLFVHLDFCVKTCQDQRTSPLLPLYPGIPPHQFWCHSDSPVLRQNCKTEYHHVITCRIMQVCIPEKFIFQTIPSVARPFKKPATSPLFTVNRHKKQFPNLKSPLLHHLFGTRLVRRETYSFDRRSLHSFLREYSSELESFFKLYFFIYYILCSKSLMSYTPALSAVI